jgi:hypothetical protein
MRKTWDRWIATTLVSVAALAFGACSDDDGVTPPPDQGEGVLQGEITGTRTLSADTTYTIEGFVIVQPGAELVIPAGTLLLSNGDSRGSLVTARCTDTEPSGQLIVQGTEADPVVFRPINATGRERGQAGGIVLHGCAPINVLGGTAVSEGVAQAFGGDDPADSSGDIRFLRIEFGGIAIATDNEINGLTLAGVGTGTNIEFVQTHFIADDGFEWFGGTVHGDHLVSSGNDDDGLDCDFGWNGTVQFALVIQDPERANRGLECDNDGDGSANQPLTDPAFWNVTWIGTAVRQANSEINDGLYIRRNAAGAVRNAIVSNFGNTGIVLDGDGTFGQLQADNLVLDNILFFGNLGLESGAVGTDDLTDNVQRRSGGAYVADGVAAELGGATFVFADPQFTSVNLTDPINGTQPNPLPASGSPALDPANAAAPSGPGIVDPVADYLGAFSNDNWIDGWTTWLTS